MRMLLVASLLCSGAACSSKTSADCTGQADGTSCNDGNPCTQSDACSGQSCIGTAVVCSGASGCTGSTCDPATGQCVTGPMEGVCSTTLQGIPLGGCAVSDYTVPVKVGDGSIYQLTLDSGSSTTALAASSCRNCGNLSPQYTPGSTAQGTTNQTSADYGGGEGWDGTVYSDVVSVGGVVADVRMDIAAITDETIQVSGAQPFFTPSYCSGNEVDNDDQGIFGLGGTGASAPHTDAYMTKLNGSGVAAVFAVQMCDVNGTIWVGGFNPSAMTAGPQYTPLLDANDYYVVNLADIGFNGVTATISEASLGEVIVDTGTSIMLLPNGAYDSLSETINANATFNQYFGSNFFNAGNCVAPPNNMTAAQLNKALPPMSLTFPGTKSSTFTISFPATESYLTPTFDSNGDVTYCPAISSSDTSGRDAMTVIGNSILHSQITIFDRQNMQIGFAPEQGCKPLGT